MPDLITNELLFRQQSAATATEPDQLRGWCAKSSA
jgi:hypothetical protein